MIYFSGIFQIKKKTNKANIKCFYMYILKYKKKEVNCQ